jgi:prophage regulatory protein
MAAQIQSALTILRRKQVEARTGLSRSTIYDRIKAGTFPAPISLGEKAVGWIESEVDAWLVARIQASRKTA